MNVELLAPAGSIESLKAAISAGADAVYIGGGKFGARAYAKNLSQEELLEAIDYAHLFDRKLYLTVNTLLKNRELEEELFEYLYPLYLQGLDAVIVQDLGVLQYVKKHFPDLAIHASTQMTITGVESAKLLASLGATRIVTARELSLKEINEIYKATKLEIESFVHGALCYCYSGQCLFSSMIGGRSGNRGRCAQPCRLPYEVYSNDKKISNNNTAYPLSPKDMCTVELLPEILNAGVHSLKIEGRMKKPEYTAGVVEIYRKNIDKYCKNQDDFTVSKEDLKQLYDIYNRDGFNKGYYKQHNGKDMLALENKKEKSKNSNERTLRNEVLFGKIRKEYIETDKNIPITGTLYMGVGEVASLTVSTNTHQVTVEGEVVQEALKQPLDEEKIRKKLMQTGNTLFHMDDCHVYLSGNVFLPIGKINELRRDALEKLKEEMLLTYRRREVTPCLNKKMSPMNHKAKISTIRVVVESKEQLESALRNAHVTGIYVDLKIVDEGYKLDSLVAKFRKYKKELYFALPRMVRFQNLPQLKAFCKEANEYEVEGYLVRNLESYGLLKELGCGNKVVIDQNMYSYNNQAVSFWKNQGVLRNTVPLELNAKELRYRDNQYSEMIVYGYCVMMVSAQCVKKSLSGCDKSYQTLKMKDRYQKEFLVQCNCKNCYNTIYNSIAYGLLGEWEEVKDLGIQDIRLDFTSESKEEVDRVITMFSKAYNDGQGERESKFTKGHFKRGVE